MEILKLLICNFINFIGIIMLICTVIFLIFGPLELFTDFHKDNVEQRRKRDYNKKYFFDIDAQARIEVYSIAFSILFICCLIIWAYN